MFIRHKHEHFYEETKTLNNPSNCFFSYKKFFQINKWKSNGFNSSRLEIAILNLNLFLVELG